MGRFAKLIDRIVTIWMIIVDIVVGFVLSAFAIAAMFNDMYYSDTWNSLLLTIIAVIMVNLINFGIKIFLRSFKK